MRNLGKHLARWVAITVAASLVASCGLPRSGPTKREIVAGAAQTDSAAFLIEVDQHVARKTSVTPSLGFSNAFKSTGPIGADTINAGDTIGLRIYENMQQGLLTNAGAPAALEEVQVDDAGMIFVPYAGRIRAAGHTPEALRQIIKGKLEEQTPDPQVMVHRLAGNGATVSITGGVASQGIYPIERPTRTLSGMLASASGISIEPEVALITVIRGQHRGTIWLEDLHAHPELDIALRNGDRIVVEADRRAFTALGATGAQRRVQFETQELSAIEAIAQVGGLMTNVADPKGVFVLRDEVDTVANAVLNRDDLVGDQRMIYLFDLTEPSGIFEARDFMIRDNDTLYVTEAPFVQWNKAISALTGSLNSVNGVAQVSGAN